MENQLNAPAPRVFVRVPDELMAAIVRFLSDLPAKHTRGLLNAIDDSCARFQEPPPPPPPKPRLKWTPRAPNGALPLSGEAKCQVHS